MSKNICHYLEMSKERKLEKSYGVSGL
jgi:hypothetical protein